MVLSFVPHDYGVRMTLVANVQCRLLALTGTTPDESERAVGANCSSDASGIMAARECLRIDPVGI